MEMGKRRSKGSFLSFFDWNGKSKKKLFCDTLDLPEVSKQGKENVDNIPMSQLNRVKVEDSGEISSNIASSDFNCALSISSDEGSGTKAPGLVARLMGLDSMPVSAVSELSSTSLYGCNSLGSSRCHEGSLYSMADCCPVDCVNMPVKLEKSSWGATESEAKKVGNPAAIRRFQSEMLPPKSAKPIPVTHNKLLSPIKGPSYKPPTNAAQIMEAAAKIIEASPHQYTRNRMSSVGPSSIPLRILDLKEKVEAAQYASKRVDLHTGNPVNGKPNDRSNNLYKGTPTFKGSEKNSSCRLASNGTPASLVILSKDNVQSRGTPTLDGKRGHMKQKEQNEVKPNQVSRSQKKQVTDLARAVQQRTFTGQNSNVLRKNNQKQNGVTNKGISTSKVESNKPSTRTWSSESSTGARKTTNKGSVRGNIEPKRLSTKANDSQKELTVSKRKSISQKKRHSSRDVQNEASGSNSDNVVNNYENKSIKCNITTEGSTDQNAISMNESTDVISFTFTSPLRRSMPESQSSTEQVMGASSQIDVNGHGCSNQLYPKKLSLSPAGLDMMDGDTLSVLLERKLQELTSRINQPQCTLASEGSSAGFRFSLEDKLHSLVSSAREQDRSFHPDILSKESERVHDNGCSSSDIVVLSMNQQLQTAEPMEEPCCSSSGESLNDLGCRHSRTFRVFENPSMSSISESCLDSEDSTTYGSTVYSSMQDEEVSNFSPIHESTSLQNGAKWSEQNSSPVAGRNMAIKQFSDVADFKRTTGKMDLQYVKDILGNAQLMVEEFVTGQTNRVIMPNLFDLLENQSNGAENSEEHSKLERKVLFDCVSECLELRCGQAFVGSCKAWPRWVAASVERKSWLAEELYKEMLGFRCMEEEEMVDELVFKDMSIGCGKWLNFDIEAFEEGLDVELDIVTNLIDELVSDLMLV